MPISGSYFKYDNISSKQYGLYLAHIQTNFSNNPLEGERKYITTKIRREKVFNILFQDVDEPFSFDIEMMTDQIITESIKREIVRWLFNRNTYKHLEILNDDYANVYYNCLLIKSEPIIIGGSGGWGTYGFKCTVQCDSPWAYEIEKTKSLSKIDDSIQSGAIINYNSLNSTKIDLSVQGKTNQTVTVQGKNLFNPLVGTTIRDGITCTVENDGTITLNGTATAATFGLPPLALQGIKPLSIISGQYYTLSITKMSGAITTGSLQIAIAVETDGTPMLISNVNNTSNVASNLLGNTAKNIWGWCNTGTTFSQFKFRLQFEQSVNVTLWEQFVPNSPSIDYPAPITGTTKTTVNGTDYPLPQTLYSASHDENTNVNDSFNFNTAKLTKYTGIYTVTGNEGISKSGTTLIDKYYITLPTCNITASRATCTHFKSGNSSTYILNEFGLYHSTFGFNFATYGTTTVTDFANWLKAQYSAGTPVMLLFELAVPQTITGTPQIITSTIGQNIITTDGNGIINVNFHDSFNGYTFNFINSSDSYDILHPKIIITTGNSGGIISLTNYDDNNNIIQFNNTSANEVITMDKYMQITSSLSINHYSPTDWNYNTFNLVNGENHITINGDIASLDIIYKNVRRCGY